MNAMKIGMVIVVLAAMGGRAGAQEAQPPPGFHTHDGFYLRLMPGLGGGASAASANGNDLSISGSGITGSLGLGFAISPSFVVSVETAALFTVSPTVELNGQSAEAEDAEFSIQYFGAGASYYFPSNFYLHGGAGALIIGVRGPDDPEATTSDTGFGFRAALGKEWWVSADWGVGIAASMLLGSVPDGDVDWSVALFGLQLSATYN